MVEIKIAGRGGQGVVMASQILAQCLFLEGWAIQSFPAFGAERRGAPVAAFVRADKKNITLRCGIRHPDWLIVFDANLMANPQVTTGLESKARILLNAESAPPDLPAAAGLFVIDATGIARSQGLVAGAFPIVNTAMVGAFAAVSGLCGEETAAQVVEEFAPTKKDQNMKAARLAFARTTEVKS